MAPDWSSQLASRLGVDIEGIDMCAVHVVPESQACSTGARHGLRAQAGCVVGAARTGGFDEHVMTRG